MKDPKPPDDTAAPPRSTTAGMLPKMMLAFVIRRCTVELGRTPDAADFAHWANHQGVDPHAYCLFGRPITEREARLILKHQARLVTAKSATPFEEHQQTDDVPPPRAAADNVISLVRVRQTLGNARPARRLSGR